MTVQMIRLGDIFEFKNGRSFKKEEWRDSGIPIIRIQNLNQLEAPYNYFDGEYDESIEVNFGDLLFSWSGTVGTSFGPHIWGREKGVLNQHIYKLSFKKEIECKYAYYALLSITKEIEKSVVGAVGLVHVTKKALNEFKILLPPLPLQKKIVAKLDAIFSQIDKASVAAEANSKNAEALFQSYLTEVFERGGEGWLTDTIGNVCTIRSGTTVDSKLEKAEGELPYLKVADMNLVLNQEAVTTSSRFLNLTDVNKNSVIRRGSTIFPKRGGAIDTNKKRLTTVDIAVDLNIMSVFPTPTLNSNLLFFYFLGINMKELGSGASIRQINNYDIEPLIINFPSDLKEQLNLVNKLTNLKIQSERLISNYRKKKVEMNSFKNSILQQAFNGELAED